MVTIRLFSARACPFAHRSRLVLTHKDVSFELVEIDLRNKPAWFDSKLSGYGKVPAIEHGEVRLWESAVINEYLDEVFQEPRLLPSDPGRRAVARIWIDYANTRLAPAFGKLLRASAAAEQAAASRELQEVLGFLERDGLARCSGDGPYFLGDAPSLVDFALYPWFERWSGLEYYRGLRVPSEHARLTRWRDALQQLAAVRAHENPTEFYVERYAALAGARAGAVVA
jgi:glutathione S-transferase